MNVSATALLLSVTLAVASTAASGETITTYTGRNSGSAKIATQLKVQKIKPAKVAQKSAKHKKRATKISTKRSSRRAKYLPLARRLKPAGLPISLVDAVITIESGYNPSARGRHGEIGLMQVKPATARMVRSLTGVHAGSLSVPSNNLRVGMAYLNWCYKRAGRNVSVTIG
ncbi:MAG: lytic transglycosylase domain-containing protein, partial [Aestuariivirgaceae bacterium]